MNDVLSALILALSAWHGPNAGASHYWRHDTTTLLRQIERAHVSDGECAGAMPIEQAYQQLRHVRLPHALSETQRLLRAGARDDWYGTEITCAGASTGMNYEQLAMDEYDLAAKQVR